MGLTLCTEPITRILVNKIWFEKLSKKIKTKELDESQISRIMRMISSVQELISRFGEIKGDFYPIDPKWPCYILTISNSSKEERVIVKGNVLMFQDGSSDEITEGDLSDFLDSLLSDTPTEEREIRILLGQP